MREIFGYTFAGIFAAAAVLHIICCFAGVRKIRMVTKPMLLILLCVVYILLAKEVRVPVICAMLLGCAGDTLLLFGDNKKLFAAGAAAFGLGHAAYFAALLPMVHISESPWIFVLCAAVCLIEPVILFIYLRRYIPAPLAPLAGAYCLFIGIMTALAAALFVRSPSAESLAALGGMAFFVASDSVLAVNVFKYESEPPVQSGIIMTTYIAAQSLLCAAFVLM